ncbi:MAG: DNA polymerase III subunit beta [Desulfuromonadales bacterium]|nr:DNA polymerase III subunit beta [Desulfuromonadales bacterium]
MEFKIQKDTFLNALFRIQGIVDKKHTIPILSNVFIEAYDNQIILSATDLEIGLKTCFKCEVKENGKITISAKKLFEIIKELPNDIINIKEKNNYWIEISCGNSLFNLVGLPPDEFPKIPEQSNDLIDFDSNILNKMIYSTVFSVSNDETKFNLTGIFVKFDDNKLNFASTDGHRLSVISKELNFQLSEKFKNGFILPKKGIIELNKIIDTNGKMIKIGVTENLFNYVDENTTFVMRMIDGDFPDYKRVIPEKTDNYSTIEVKKFTDVLKRISVLSNEKTKGVKINIFDNKLVVSSSNPDFGDAKEEMDVVYKGDDITIGFNARYIIDILNIINEEKINFYIKDNISPGMIIPLNNEEYLSVVMPMRF